MTVLFREKFSNRWQHGPLCWRGTNIHTLSLSGNQRWLCQTTTCSFLSGIWTSKGQVQVIGSVRSTHKEGGVPGVPRGRSSQPVVGVRRTLASGSRGVGVASLASIPVLQPRPWFHLPGSPWLLLICEAGLSWSLCWFWELPYILSINSFSAYVSQGWFLEPRIVTQNLSIHSANKVFYFSLSFFFFWSCHTACGILVARPGTKPVPPAVEVWSPNN